MHIDTSFNNNTDKKLLSWMAYGSKEQQVSAAWIGNEITFMEFYVFLSGSCLARKSDLMTWHLQKKPCNLLYRSCKYGNTVLKITYDEAINGNRDWSNLAQKILARPDGP